MSNDAIRWGRVAALVPIAVALLPVAVVAGPAVVAVLAVRALANGWNAHPGELFGGVVAPIAYTFGMIGVLLNILFGGDDWSAAWMILASVLVAAVALPWAARDYRRRLSSRR